MWLVCGSMRIKEKTSRKHMFKRDWTTSSNNNNYSTLNSEHNWEDVWIQLRNQQTCTSDNYNLIRGGPIFNPILHMFHCRFAIATWVLLCKCNSLKLKNMKNETNDTHIPKVLNTIIDIQMPPQEYALMWEVTKPNEAWKCIQVEYFVRAIQIMHILCALIQSPWKSHT